MHANPPEDAQLTGVLGGGVGRAGKFWWRGRMAGRKSGCEVRLGERLIAFPIFTFLVACETALMLGLVWSDLPLWAHRYFGICAVLQCLWALFGMLWGTSSIMVESIMPRMDTLDSAIAIRDSMIAKVGCGSGHTPQAQPRLGCCVFC